MNFITKYSGVIALVILVILGGVKFFRGNSFGTATDCIDNTCLTSLYVTPGTLAVAGATTLGTLGVGAITGTGNLSITTTGTTTASFLSSSATKGFCLAFNATSSATLLNMTFAASSTPSTVGVAPIVRYGACN